tara:strand:+ start:2066 stop:3703 length:1638 start_codon:yes stop_codon:yes gene_type:complete
MAYLGARPTTNFRVAPTKDTFTGDGSTTTFDLANVVPAGGENALQVFVENVRQEPGSGKAYTLGADGSGDLKRITFSSAPVASAEIYVITTFSNEAFAKIEDLKGSEFVLDADGDTTITADTDDQIDIKIAGADDFQFTANTFTAQSGSTIAAQALTATTLTTSSTVDIQGQELILDADNDTSITADTDDQIDFKVGGSDEYQLTATKLDIKGNELVLDADGDTSITADTDDQIDFKTGGTDRARIDSSGRIIKGHTGSITTGSRASAVQITGTSAADSSLSIMRFNSSGGAAELILGQSRNSSIGGNTIVQNGDNVGMVQFVVDDGTDYVSSVAEIRCDIDGAPGENDTPGRLRFSTTADGSNSTTERMRIDDAGNVLIGTTSTSINSSNFGIMMQQAGTVSVSSNQGAGNTVTEAFGNAGQFRVMGDGDAENTNNRYGALSDRTLKENETSANSQWDDIKALQIKNYNLIEYPDRTHIGVIAQDLESAGMNGLVKTNSDGLKSVAYSVLYMKAVKALQEAITKIETLETEMTALKARVTTLEG